MLRFHPAPLVNHGGAAPARRRGSIRERGRASWEVRVFVGANPETGKSDYASRTVRGSRRDAEVELTKLLKQVDDGAITPRSGSVGELTEAWYRQRAPSLSPPVAHNYRRLIDRFILARWGATPLRRIRVADLDAWYSQLLRSGGAGGRPLSASSVRRVHAVLRSVLEQGVKWGALAANPAAAASPPPVHRRQVELKAGGDDWARLVEAAGEVNRALPVFVRLALATGARRGELCALRWRDVDLSRGEVRIGRAIVEAGGVVTEKDTKTHQVRRVSIDPGTVEMLREYRSELGELCTSAGGALSKDAFIFSHQPDGSTPWRPNYVTLAFCRLRDRLGLDGLRLHDLRHASASLMQMSDVVVGASFAMLCDQGPVRVLGFAACSRGWELKRDIPAQA
ncbi:MAG: tyrosine-type recombinase/integrase, partial [Acidimicrobiales bacterium]